MISLPQFICRVYRILEILLSAVLQRLPVDHGGPVDRPFDPFPPSAVEGSMKDRFDKIALDFPTRVAISDRVGCLTYGELAKLVEQIKQSISLALATRPGPVAILLSRNRLFPAAIILDPGGGFGYVALDGDHPTERNRIIAQQSGAIAVISAGDLACRARSLFPDQLPVLDIDPFWRSVTYHSILSPRTG